MQTARQLAQVGARPREHDPGTGRPLAVRLREHGGQPLQPQTGALAQSQLEPAPLVVGGLEQPAP